MHHVTMLTESSRHAMTLDDQRLDEKTPNDVFVSSTKTKLVKWGGGVVFRVLACVHGTAYSKMKDPQKFQQTLEIALFK